MPISCKHQRSTVYRTSGIAVHERKRRAVGEGMLRFGFGAVANIALMAHGIPDSEPVQFNVEFAECPDSRLKGLGDTLATSQELSHTLEYMVARSTKQERLNRQTEQIGAATISTVTLDKPTSTDQGTASVIPPEEDYGERNVERRKGKNAISKDDNITKEALRFLSESLSNALRGVISEKADEMMTGLRDDMEARLTQLEHKLDILVCAGGITEGAVSAETETSPHSPSKQLIAMAAIPAYPSRVEDTSPVDLLIFTPNRVPAGDSIAGTFGFDKTNLVDVSERKHEATPLASKTHAEVMPEEGESVGAKQETAFKVAGDQKIVPSQTEREMLGPRITSSGARKRMLITFSSSDDEVSSTAGPDRGAVPNVPHSSTLHKADESMTFNVKRPRSTPGRGTKSMTPPGTDSEPTIGACRPKSSSAKAICKKSEPKERPAEDLPILPFANGTRARRLTVSPELP